MFSPLWGDGTGLFVTITAPGYHPLTIYHEPDWSYTEERGFYSVLDNVWLAKDTDVDSDGDGLYDSQELRIGTDPHNWDTDGDGLSDFAEVYGSQYQDLRRYGASPLRKDIFVECDYYNGYKPLDQAIEDVIEAFANAPITNPDGTTGVNLVVDVDDEIASEDAPAVLDLTNGWKDYKTIRAKYMTLGRSGLYHYCLWASQYDIGDGPTKSTGRAELPGDAFLITRLSTEDTSEMRIKQAGTFMHELGHNLGLAHALYNTNYQPNYFSVMSYFFQLDGLALRASPSEIFVDYSRQVSPSIHESQLDEPLGFGNALANAFVPRYRRLVGGSYVTRDLTTLGSQVDFNGNSIIDLLPVAMDLDGDGVLNTIQASQNDWVVLDYSSGGKISDDLNGVEMMRTIEDRLRNVSNKNLRNQLVNDGEVELLQHVKARDARYVTAMSQGKAVECAAIE